MGIVVAMPKSLAPTVSRRLRWTDDDARRALDAHARSGLSIRAFAESAGVDVQRLMRWRRKWEAPSAAPPSKPKPKPVAFVEVRQRESDRVEVVLRSGRILRCTEEISVAALRRFVSVLEDEPAC